MTRSGFGIGPTLPYRVKAAVTLARSAAWAARAGGRPECRGLRILLYHRVADDGDPLAIPPRRFREQMDHLAAEGYRAVDLLAGARAAGAGAPRARARSH